MNAPGARAWLSASSLLVVLALAGTLVPHAALDWQPGLAWQQPWRWWSAAAVHYSPLHLLANLAGLALVGGLGVVAEVPRRVAYAWVAAWPLTQLGLLLRPDLLHYGGLSGVLHAGVAVAALYVATTARGARRGIGIAMLLMLSAKVLSETPWGAPLRHPEGWDIAVAPLAHATGLVAGLLCALPALTLRFPSND